MNEELSLGGFSKLKKVILKIGGMSCSACSNAIEKYLNKQERDTKRKCKLGNGKCSYRV